MKDNITKLLGLEDVIIKNIWEDEESKHIELELPRKGHHCPCCGTRTEKTHDYRMQRIKDCPAFGKQVYLHPRKRRYVCPSCGKRFYEDNSFVPRYYRITARKCAQIINAFRETVSASHIAREHNISVSTALRYFDLVNYGCNSLPEVLPIDEFKGDAGGEKYQSIITDAKNHRPIDILPNRKKSELLNYFCKFENRRAVKSETAAKLMGVWIYHAESSSCPEFHDCSRAIHNWSRYILNSFDCPYTNGFTEGCNNKTKVIKRVSYGIRNFPRFRNRILHCSVQR